MSEIPDSLTWNILIYTRHEIVLNVEKTPSFYCIDRGFYRNFIFLVFLPENLVSDEKREA